MNKREFLPGIIAVSLILILAFCIVALFTMPMPMTESAGTLAVALITAVTTNVAAIVGYYFGSSKSSKEKDATILAQATGSTTETPAPPATPVRPTLTAVPPAPGA